MSDTYGLLRDVVNHIDVNSQDKVYRNCGKMLNAKKDVLSRFQPIFSPDKIDGLTAHDYREFLKFENNQHWTGLSRTGNAAANNMPFLREKLEILVDENLPITQRFDVASKISGIGKAILTAILHITYPEKYGVWNDRLKPMSSVNYNFLQRQLFLPFSYHNSPIN